jgi:uncharacterized protein YndB with AHSA1/START domain
MAKSEFVYVTYIKTTPRKLWEAITNSEFMKQYWFGVHFETDWKKGSPWKMIYGDGRLTDSGKILSMDPPLRLVLSWRNEWKPELKAEGYGRCVMEIEPLGKLVRLTVTHSINRPQSKLIGAVSGGWPLILSNLKSLLESGKVIMKSKP